MEFREVAFKDVIENLSDMFKDHYEEIARYKDIELKLNKARYLEIAELKAFRFYVAEHEGAMIGYAGFFVTPHMHYDDSIQAVQDVIYIESKYRGTGEGAKFITYCDDELRKLGVQVVYHHCKVKKDFGPTLIKQGYEHVENIYGKRLDK